MLATAGFVFIGRDHTLAPIPYRYVYIGLGCLVVAAIALGVAFGGTGEPAPLPAPIESIFPERNGIVLRQAYVEIDLEPSYRAQIFVNGFLVPDTELTYVESTGVHRWQPSATSLILDAWLPGQHEIRVVWDTIVGLPAPGEFTWTFRVQ